LGSILIPSAGKSFAAALQTSPATINKTTRFFISFLSTFV
jgi:hypothetical protein